MEAVVWVARAAERVVAARAAVATVAEATTEVVRWWHRRKAVATVAAPMVADRDRRARSGCPTIRWKALR